MKITTTAAMSMACLPCVVLCSCEEKRPQGIVP